MARNCRNCGSEFNPTPSQVLTYNWQCRDCDNKRLKTVRKGARARRPAYNSVNLPFFERFAAQIMPVTESGCWLWIGALNAAGYGLVRRPDRTIHGAHRRSWEDHHGPIPDGLSVCHSCDVPCCVNPEHLWLGTQADNNWDRARKGRSSPTRAVLDGVQPHAKLTQSNVEEIRASGLSNVSLAARFGVSASTISLARRGKNWQWLAVASGGSRL